MDAAFREFQIHEERIIEGGSLSAYITCLPFAVKSIDTKGVDDLFICGRLFIRQHCQLGHFIAHGNAELNHHALSGRRRTVLLHKTAY